MKKINKKELLNFTDKQTEARKAVRNYKYVLYGGAMGGGKSYFLRWEIVDLLLKWSKRGFKNIEAGLFCEDYPSLKDRQISKIVKEFPKWLGEYHADHKAHGRCFILDPEYGSHIIKLRNLDDPSKYQSAEFAIIAIDELTKDPEETFEDLRNRLRWPGLGDEVRFFGGTNPGGIGHAWVKKRWLDADFEPEEQEPEKFFYVPATVEDNPYLDESYLKSLDSLPPEKRKAYREGDWDIFKGQYFSEWRREIHTCVPFVIPAEWKKFIMGDYGYAKPSAVYWGAVDSEGVLYLYRELYETELTFSRLTERIVGLTPDNEQIDYWVFDPSIWTRRGENVGAMSGAEIMMDVYKKVMRVPEREKRLLHLHLKQGNKDRINGWAEIREMLRPILIGENLKAKLQVFTTCPNFIRTFPSLIYDEHRVEDLDTDGEDHAADAVRYGVMSRPTPSRTKEQVQEAFFRKKMKLKKLGR